MPHTARLEAIGATIKGACQWSTLWAGAAAVVVRAHISSLPLGNKHLLLLPLLIILLLLILLLLLGFRSLLRIIIHSIQLNRMSRKNVGQAQGRTWATEPM